MPAPRPSGLKKIPLPRSGPGPFWAAVDAHFAGGDARRWKYLAMLSLRENCGWPLESVGAAFGHPKGHVSRCLAKVKADLRVRFEPGPPDAGGGDAAWPELTEPERAAAGREEAARNPPNGDAAGRPPGTRRTTPP